MENFVNTAAAKVLEAVIDDTEGDLEAAKATLEDGEYLAYLEAKGLLPEAEEKAIEIVDAAYGALLRLAATTEKPIEEGGCVTPLN